LGVPAKTVAPTSSRLWFDTREMAADASTVTVIGLGLMGSALARAFLQAGHELTVWNRTPAKTAAFEGLARIAGTVQEACAASDAVVVSVPKYEVSNALLARRMSRRSSPAGPSSN
jgi:3-hydroxyisobutyrate dehydrogenase-like beta-hydroxyacid dehydrogenase